MQSVLFKIRGALANALAFSSTSFLFSKLKDHGEKERKKRDLTPERL